MALEIMTAGLERLEVSQPVFLVNFSGAVIDRVNKTGPFYSGIQIASEVNLPLIAIGDPTVTRDPNLSLAWYAGFDSMLDLPDRIADELERIAAKYNARLILFGGSGGGFAALNVSSRLKCHADVYVFNPQIFIERYSSKFTARYLRSAFPQIASSLSDAETPLTLAKVFKRIGIDNCVSHAQTTGQILYLQNASDWHVQSHTIPFMEVGQWLQTGEIYRCSARRATVWLGNWGHGHVAPPRTITATALRMLADGNDVDHIAQVLASQCSASQR